MTAARFVKQISEVRFANCFNPYSDHCDVHDRQDAPKVRAHLLESILRNAAKSQIDAIWLGRDLGYRGGRRTGLALTDDVHMNAHLSRWALTTRRPTKGEVIAERTAAVVWQMLRRIEDAIFLWNVFPLHPHEPNAPFTNRTHSAAERLVGEALLIDLLKLLEPRRIIAIGNDAANAARRVVSQDKVFAVRHPSYGGQTQFIRQISGLYHLQEPLQRELI